MALVEAQFAEKLAAEFPTKLPSPAHLTINGESYDGSKNVFLDLQERICDEKPGATLADNVAVTSGMYSWISYNIVNGYEELMVAYDGVTYACPITFRESITEYGDESFFYVGNWNNSAPEYPFFIWGYINNNSATVNVGSGTHTLSVAIAPYIQKIDKKFLPDTVDWDIVPKESYALGGEYAEHPFEGITPLVAGKTYIAIIDGVEYTRVAKRSGEMDYTYIGNESIFLGEPGEENDDNFCFWTWDDGQGAIYMKEDDYAGKSIVFGVREKTSGGSGGGVSSWNDLKDKPFHDEEGTEKIDVECLPEGYPYVYGPEINPYFDGNLTGREVFPVEAGTSLVKITDYVLTEAQCIDQTVELSMAGQSLPLTVTEDMLTDLTAEFGISMFAIMFDSTPAVVVARESGTVQGLAVSAGTYYLHAEMDGYSVYISHFSGLPEDDGAQKMDSRLLPAVGCNTEPFFVSDSDGGSFRCGSYAYFRASKKMKEQLNAGIIKISFDFTALGETEVTRVTTVLTGTIDDANGIFRIQKSTNPKVNRVRYTVNMRITSGEQFHIDFKPLLSEGNDTSAKNLIVQNMNGVYEISVDYDGNLVAEKIQ